MNLRNIQIGFGQEGKEISDEQVKQLAELVGHWGIKNMSFDRVPRIGCWDILFGTFVEAPSEFIDTLPY